MKYGSEACGKDPRLRFHVTVYLHNPYGLRTPFGFGLKIVWTKICLQPPGHCCTNFSRIPAMQFLEWEAHRNTPNMFSRKQHRFDFMLLPCDHTDQKKIHQDPGEARNGGEPGHPICVYPDSGGLGRQMQDHRKEARILIPVGLEK